MRPWQHARSSAGKNGNWLTDLPIHEFIDSTKAACPDLRHRMILHNADLGAELTARAFPHRADARNIMLDHLGEDLGCQPTLGDWLVYCDKTSWPRPLQRRSDSGFDAIIRQISQTQGIKDEAHVREVLELLLLPARYAADDALPVLFNGFGPVIVKSILGCPRVVAGWHADKVIFDPAHAAEALIYYYYGTIPALEEITSAVRRFPAKLERGHA